ncbi:DEP domain-containing protein 7-like [Styela clava]
MENQNGEELDYNNCLIGNTKSENKAFKATRIWKVIVNSFESQMYCGRRRKNLKIYEDCFTGSSAVTTMHSILKEIENYENVSRCQAKKLLQKFMDQRIIEDVNGKWLSEEFKDSGKLYRFFKYDFQNELNGKKDMSLNRSGSIQSLLRTKSLSRSKSIMTHSPTKVKKYSISSYNAKDTSDRESSNVKKIARILFSLNFKQSTMQ